MVTARWNGKIIAQSEDTLIIEGNHYFPPESIHKEYFKPSDMHTICPWKGQAHYYNIEVEGEINKDGAWYYPKPKKGSPERVGRENEKNGPFDFANYVAFWHGVEVKEE